MFILMNEESNEIYCFVVTETRCMTITQVRKNGLTKVTSSSGAFGMNLWHELKEQGWVEVKKPEVEYPNYDDDDVELIR